MLCKVIKGAFFHVKRVPSKIKNMLFSYAIE